MRKEKFFLLLIAFVLIIGVFFQINAFLNPPRANDDDVVFEAIGGDDFLNVTLKHRLKIDEKSIPDGSFETSHGKVNYYDAKNITYVDTFRNKDYFIVWKTTPDKYPWVKTNNKVNQYLSSYLAGSIDGKCFVEYSWEDNYVYGVMLSTHEHRFTESDLIYDILGLNKTGFDLVYSSPQQTSTGFSKGSSSHYHTVVPDRYSLSRSDPGAYYDHYEYGDNYDIDDYLESEGYD